MAIIKSYANHSQMHKRIIFPFVIGSFLLCGCSTHSGTQGTKVMFETQSEAEKAAVKLNCIGAHKMGDKWMPCSKHESHHH